MKQMSIDQEYVVETDLAGVASLLKPVVFKDGDSFCVILGEDPVKGVFGCGGTVTEALTDWDKGLKTRLKHGDDQDEVVKHVKSVLASLPPPLHVQEFMDQFRPVKKR